MKKLFGTDGIRGLYGRSPLNKKDVQRLGWAAGRILRRKYPNQMCRVFVVRDTRQSGQALLDSLVKGLRGQGIDVYDGGILCTPSVAYLVQSHRFHSGVVISASHNPPQFNGIKFFNSHGRKWPDEWERDVEKIFFGKQSEESTAEQGHFIPSSVLAADYERFLLSTLGANKSFKSLRVAIDCSNGANYKLGPQLLKKMGAEVFAISNKPNGKNINIKCGSQYTDKLSKLVKKKKCHAGVAFDGDGDRVIFVDEKGNETDGDHLIALLAKTLKTRKELKRNKAVITVMSNLGLRKALKKMGVKTITTSVGDRYVSYAMRTHKAVLGGEQSGHIIMGQHLPTGDGLLTALHVLNAMLENRKPLSKMVSIMKKISASSA